ncbi:MAG: hypothetical protein DWQ47_07460 [Acidobacteria bacterium]|nr:MAG: hypothetical protein DWQ32_15560 [Acidobacteriota bacterium]REJ99239.1 MAG: hypothetical protein DWQ38_14415 [Acidobacteriota bacterium]REK16040.1 MAG: hypothetical protein DWQ43_03270 [Acidobacteriota bacterium]REK43721.1 MAG: hypothetical protein DWQ47_07460 [Acidobacteriota bacterium]
MIIGKVLTFRKFFSPVLFFALVVALALPLSTDGRAPRADEVDDLLSKLGSVRELATECINSDCPDPDRAEMQRLLDALEDAQLFARLHSFWITQLPSYESSQAQKTRVEKLRRVYSEIRKLIFTGSDGASLMLCVAKLNESRGENLTRALVDFNRNTGKEAIPQWVWESVNTFGSSFSLDTTETPERAPDAVRELAPMIGKTLNALEIPELGAGGTKLEAGKSSYEPGSPIQVKYELSPCVRQARFVLIGAGEADERAFNQSSVITYRDNPDVNTGSVTLRAPERGGSYEVRVFDRYTETLLKAKAAVNIGAVRSTAYPGVYKIVQSSLKSEIGSHIAIVADSQGNHYWGSVFQSPVSDEWQFSQRAFWPDDSKQAYVGKAKLEGTRLSFVRRSAACEGSAKEIPLFSVMYLQSEGTMLISRVRAWDCSSGEPVLQGDDEEFDFQAQRVSGEPPAIPEQ